MAPHLFQALGLATATLFTLLPTPALCDKEPTQLYSWYKNYYPQPEDYCAYTCLQISRLYVLANHFSQASMDVTMLSTTLPSTSPQRLRIQMLIT